MAVDFERCRICSESLMPDPEAVGKIKEEIKKLEKEIEELKKKEKHQKILIQLLQFYISYSYGSLQWEY